MATSRTLAVLSAVLGPASTGASSPRPGVVAELPIESIVLPPAGRTVRDDANDPELAALAESMRTSGLLHALGVRLLATGLFEVIYGSRRLRAARHLGWKTLSCMLHLEMADEPALVAALSENIHRRDLSVKERTAALRMLASVYRPGTQLGGYSTGGHGAIQPPPRQPGSAGDLGRRLGVHPETITRLAKLGQDEELLGMVEAGQLSLTAGSHLARLPSGSRQPLLEEAMRGRLSASALHKRVNAALRDRPSPVAAPDSRALVTPANNVVHRLKTIRGQLAAIDRVNSAEEHQLLEDIQRQVQRLRGDGEQNP